MAEIRSLSSSTTRSTRASYTSVLPACLWLKSTFIRPEAMCRMTPDLPSISTRSPTETFSSSSPSLRERMTRIFECCTSPNPFSGGTSTRMSSSSSAPSSASSSPFRTQPAPIETSFGAYARPGRAASSERVVSKTSPPFMRPV